MENSNFTLSVNWMATKYNEMNQWLFGGSLGYCDFDIFTSGEGSEGGILGVFRITGDNIMYDGDTQRLFRKHGEGNYEWINTNNFVEICKPKIELNGNYIGSEKSFLTTLIHEMCHYYNYKDGLVPASPHGVEFKKIAKIVSENSNGTFTVERVETAEQASDLQLTDKIQQRKNKRIDNKKRAVTAIFRFTNEGDILLTITSNKDLMDELLATYYDCKKIVTSNDYDLITLLFNKGYKRDFKAFNYWDVTDEDFVYELGEYNISTIENKKPKQVFVLKTDNGIEELDFGGQKFKLYSMIKAKLPSVDEDEIWDLIYDKSNYKTISENKIDIRRIIRESIYNIIRCKKPRV